MSALEVARKKLAEVRARRNGHSPTVPLHVQTYEENEGYEESRRGFPFNCDPPVLLEHVQGHEENEEYEVSPDPAPSPDSAQPFTRARRDDLPYRLVTDPSGLTMVSLSLDNAATVALDLETTGLNPRTDRIRLLSVATDTTDGEPFAYLIDVVAVDPSPLWPLLAERQLVGHNLLFDLTFLARLGFEAGAVHDTMLLSQLLYGTRKPKGFHTLEQVAERELGEKLTKDLQRSDWSGVLSPEELDYAAKDVLVLLPLLDSLCRKIKDTRQERVAEIERRCLPAVA